jgi:DNA-binding IclR family transcriptional regulator
LLPTAGRIGTARPARNAALSLRRRRQLAHLPIIESFAGPCLLADAGQTLLRRLVRASRPRNWLGQTEAQWRQRIADVRRKGWCLDPGVFHQRIAAISAAVRGPQGDVLAAISLLGLPGEFSLRAAQRFRLPLLRAVQAAQAPD